MVHAVLIQTWKCLQTPPHTTKWVAWVSSLQRPESKRVLLWWKSHHHLDILHHPAPLQRSVHHLRWKHHWCCWHWWVVFSRRQKKGIVCRGYLESPINMLHDVSCIISGKRISLMWLCLLQYNQTLRRSWPGPCSTRVWQALILTSCWGGSLQSQLMWRWDG